MNNIVSKEKHLSYDINAWYSVKKDYKVFIKTVWIYDQSDHCIPY